METSDRLLIARKTLGINQDEFSRGIGLKRGSYSDIERGKVSNLSESTLMLLEINFGINREWVLNGVGEMFLTTANKNKETETEKFLKIIEGQKKEIESLKILLLKISQMCEEVKQNA